MHAALSGVFMQIFNHGITAAALFYFVGLLEQRRGLRGIDDFGGLMQRTPLLCGWMSVAMFSSLGLPGLNGFIGEFLIFKGSFAVAASFTAVAVIGLLVTAIVFMRAMQALFSGPLAESCSALFPISLTRNGSSFPSHCSCSPSASRRNSSSTFSTPPSRRWRGCLPDTNGMKKVDCSGFDRFAAGNLMIAWTIYITFAGAVPLLFLPRTFSRWIALLTTVAGFAISLSRYSIRRLSISRISPQSSAFRGCRRSG